MKPLAWAALLLGLASALVAAQPSSRTEVRQKVDKTRQDLKQLEREKLQAKQAVKQHAKAEKDLMGRLDSIQRRAEAARRDASVHVRNLAVVEDRLSALKERQGQASLQEQADRDALRSQLRAVQRSRTREGAAALLFSARSPAQWSARASALRELSLGTRRKVMGLRKRLDLLASYQQEYTQREQDLKGLRAEALSARQRALVEAGKSQLLLRTERQKKAQALQTAKSLEESASRLQDLLGSLQKESQRLLQRQAQQQKHAGNGKAPKVTRTTEGPSSIRGRVPWPVIGKLLSRFGKQRHPIFNVNVFNRGIEIAAPYGSPIKSIAAGTVEHVGEMQDFGTLVVVDHGGGLKSVYGYASNALVKVDEAVTQGEPLAEVGEHGAAGQPALYFQISQNARPQDPLHYLSRR